MRHSLAVFLAVVVCTLAGCVATPAAKTTTLPPVSKAPSVPELGKPAEYLAKLWNMQGMFTDTMIATYDNGRMYLAGAPRGLQVIDAKTGETLWIHKGDYLLDQPPTVYKQKVYIVEGSDLVVLSAEDGRELGRGKTKAGILTPLYPSDDLVLAGSPDQHINAFAPGGGYRIFQIGLNGGYPTGSVWANSGLAYFVTSLGEIYAISIPTHSLAWRFEFKLPNCGAPIIADQMLFIGNEDGRLYVFELITGQLKWKVMLTGPALGAAPVVARDRVYASSSREVIHAIDLNTHQMLWHVPGHKVITTTPKHVIYYEHKGDGNYVCVADIKTGELLTRASALPYKFFLADPDSGIFYAIDSNGDVLAMADREVAEEMERIKNAQ